MKRRLMTFFACMLLSVGAALAQTRVSGTVISSEDGEPIIGASIRVDGTKEGTVTDFNGKFSLNTSANATLTVSYVGMVTKTVKATEKEMRIVLDVDASVLDEVVVVAFGTAKRSQFTGSATVVGSEEISKSQVTSVTNALAGAVPGVQLRTSTGAPGATSSITIRGFSSLNAGNDPLIIVDGAPYSGDLGNLNPNDVESMTVLKDAASNALYGARGANGVIMITTKQAAKGKDAVITVDAKWGGNTKAMQQYDVVTDPAMYYEMHYGALNQYYLNQGYSATEAWQKANANLFGDQANGGLGYNIWTYPDGQVLIGQNGKLNPNATLGRIVTYNGEDYLVTPDDWEDVGTRTGFRQEYNISASGATEKSSFYLSLGYLDNEGITDASDLKRLTTRLRADYQVKKWLKLGGNVAYTRFDGNTLSNNGTSTSTGNIWAFTSQTAPIYPVYIRNADGSIKVDSDGILMMDYGNGTNAGYSRPWISDANPIQDSYLNTQNYEGNAVSASGFANIDLYKGLTLTVNGSFNLDETRSTYVYNPYYGQFDSTGGTVYKENYRTYDYNLQQLLNYRTTIAKKHNVEVMLGHEFYEYQYKYLGASKSNMFSQDNKELDGAVIDGQEASSYVTTHNSEGYFGRVQYNYDERIFGSASYRRDASSRFHPDHRWGSFWSLGAAWIMSKEKWFDVNWVNEFKVKASYGVQGNDDIGLYRYTDVFTITNSDGNVGTSFDTKGTEDITWETNGNFNAGIEFQLLKSRITGSIEYYYRKTTDMLFSFSVAPSLGYSNYYDNIGDMYNTGVEMNFNFNILNKKDLKWDINFNLSTVKNRITKLHEDKKTSTEYDAEGNSYDGYTSDNFFISEDVSIYTWRLKEYAGVSEDGLSMWYYNVYDDDGNLTGRETTTSYSDADYYVTNKSTLPKAFGGFGTTVAAYGFDFSINFSYQIGGYQYDSTYAQFMSSPTSSNAGYNFHKDLLKSWTADNTDTNIPRFVWGDTYSAAASTRFLTKASYLNIENINFGYTIPEKYLKKISISSLRLYLACENVFYWSKRRGFDPRQSYISTSNATRYSPMRTISGGLTVSF